MIIETCPVCGHDLMNSVICTNPPIPRKECHHCGWSWEGQQETTSRLPVTNCDIPMPKKVKPPKDTNELEELNEIIKTLDQLEFKLYRGHWADIKVVEEKDKRYSTVLKKVVEIIRKLNLNK